MNIENKEVTSEAFQAGALIKFDKLEEVDLKLLIEDFEKVTGYKVTGRNIDVDNLMEYIDFSFDDFNSSYMYELNNLRLEKEEIEKTKKHSNNLNWLDNFKKNQNISEINRNIVDEFIKDIYL